MRSAFSLLALVFVFSLGLTACSPEPLASPAPEESIEEVEPDVEDEPSQDPDLPTDEDLRSYVDAIANQSASDLQAAEDLVVEGSPADDYLTYYLHYTNALVDAGMADYGTSRVREVEDGFELCDSGEEDICTNYTDFEGKDSKISNFQVQGRELSERLVVGSGETIQGPNGSEIEFIAAYRNAADTDLIFAYTLRSGSTAMLMPDVSYRNPDGRQTQAETHVGAWDLASDSYSSYIAMFPAGELGGQATIEVWPEEGSPVPVTLSTTGE